MAVYQRPTTATDVLGVAAAAWSGVWSISWSDARSNQQLRPRPGATIRRQRGNWF